VSSETFPRAGIADLRQYTLHPGRRDDLIDLFESHFVAGQEDAGMHIVGQFRDLDDPDRFVWLRAYDSWSARGEALAAFYYGPVWQAHRDRANATLIDSDDALLLRPVQLGPGYPRFGTAPCDDVEPTSVVGITVVYRDRAVDAPFCELIVNDVASVLSDTGGEAVAVLVSDPSPNNFPALPLRDENAVAWINRFEDDAAYAEHRRQLSDSPVWRNELLPTLLQTAKLPMQQLRLRPTPRSQLR
jgi:quinol monooxygenase YgiN